VGNATHVQIVDAKAWRDKQTKRKGSWWQDWAKWLNQNCGPLRNPHQMGSSRFPKLCAAPGTYVHET
jgi:poly[(R)-3-hydroxyalkanoate] polymerase subunit PhaC